MVKMVAAVKASSAVLTNDMFTLCLESDLSVVTYHRERRVARRRSHRQVLAQVSTVMYVCIQVLRGPAESCCRRCGRMEGGSADSRKKE